MSVTIPDPQKILALPMRSTNSAQADTVRDYLVAVLARLWSQGLDFSARRPFGNSGWEYDLYAALVDGGLLAAADDVDDCQMGCPQDPGAAYDLITSAIAALATPAAAVDPVPAPARPIEAPTDADLRTVAHPNHDYATDGWRWHCSVCNPLDSDLAVDPAVDAEDEAWFASQPDADFETLRERRRGAA